MVKMNREFVQQRRVLVSLVVMAVTKKKRDTDPVVGLKQFLTG
jgi:hypothetical protein